MNWLTITVAAAIAGCAAWFLVAFLDQELDRLLQDALQTAAFVVVWANAVWWLPDLRRAESDITDRVVRAHLD